MSILTNILGFHCIASSVFKLNFSCEKWTFWFHLNFTCFRKKNIKSQQASLSADKSDNSGSYLEWEIIKMNLKTISFFTF